MCKKEERRTNREREGERVETSAHISITMTKTAPIAAMDYSHLWLPGTCLCFLCGYQVGLLLGQLYANCRCGRTKYFLTSSRCKNLSK